MDWVRFSDDVESIFTTKDLEKAPLLEIDQLRPPVDWQMNQMDEEETALCMGALKRLAEKVQILMNKND